MSWVRGKSFLLLHNGYVVFKPLLDTPQNHYLWVNISGLPLEFWSRRVLMEIGNAIGKFIYINLCCLGIKDKRISWILVELHFSGGLPAHIDIA